MVGHIGIAHHLHADGAVGLPVALAGATGASSTNIRHGISMCTHAHDIVYQKRLDQ